MAVLYRNNQTRSEVDFSAYALSDPTGGHGTAASLTGTAQIPGQVYNTTQFGDGSSFTGAGPQGYSRIQQDIFLNFHKTYHDFKGNLLLGNTIWQEYYQNIQNSSTNLLVNNFYNIGSIHWYPNYKPGYR